MNKITDGTFIPLSFLTIVVAGAFWLASMSNQTTANAADLLELKSDLKEQRIEDRIYFEKRYDRLEGKLDTLLKRK